MDFTPQNSSLTRQTAIVPVVAVALVDDAGRVLMQRRRADGEHGGLWEFPGGKVESGESFEAALVREAREELGIGIDAADLFPIGYACDSPGRTENRRRYLILLFGARIWRSQPRCLAGEAIAWFAPAELETLEMPPLDIPLAKKLARPR